MIIRETCLPLGWYPRDRAKVSEFLSSFERNGSSCAVLAPHAGWFYSGSTAAIAVSSLKKEADTVAVIGGHLPAGMPVLLASEDGVKTPMGVMKIDKALREEFSKRILADKKSVRDDRYEDNTVEVLLPMVHYFFPGADLLWLRFPAEISSYNAGKILAETAGALDRRIVVVGSTDLTHYGRNYGFSPRGSGLPALEWVKEVNDASFIAAVLKGEPSLVYKRASEDLSACSAGAVLGSLGFASAFEKQAALLDYRTSAEAGDDIPDSFVGYAAISLAQG